MKKILVIVLGFILMSADVVDYSYYQKDDTNAKIKAVFIYNFTRYFEWPSKNGNFVIALCGDNANLVTELNKMASTKLVGDQKIEIKTVSTIKEAEKANILFLMPDKSGNLADALTKAKGKGTLVITEKNGLAKVGSTINFIIQENKQKFELNKASAAKAGLKVSSTLDQLAAEVIH